MKKTIRKSAVAAVLTLPMIGGGVSAAQAIEWGSEPTLKTEAVTQEDQDAFKAYWDAEFSYEQLTNLAAEWNGDEFQAKARAGALILSGDTSEIEAVVGAPAGPEADAALERDTEGDASVLTDSFLDAGFAYEDAEALAAEWNVAPFDAKVMAASQINDGGLAAIEELVASLTEG